MSSTRRAAPPRPPASTKRRSWCASAASRSATTTSCQRHAQPGDHARDRLPGGVRRDPFGPASGRAGDQLGRPARIRAGARARRGRDRSVRPVHGNASRPGQRQVRRAQCLAARPHGKPADDPGRARSAGEGAGLRGSRACDANMVFIQANARQMLGAKISAYSYRRNARDPDSFRRPHPRHRGLSAPDAARASRSCAPATSASGTRTICRASPRCASIRRRRWGSRARRWSPIPTASASAMSASCSSATWPARRSGRCRGRATTTQPDYIATSVMLLDCAKLTHWQFDKDLDDLFAPPVRLCRLDRAQARGPLDHRLARARMERLRPPDPADQAAPHDQAQDPAVEDRASGRLHACAKAVRSTSFAGWQPPLRAASRPQPGSVASIRCWPRWSTTARSPRASWSRRWRPTTSATIRSS